MTPICHSEARSAEESVILRSAGTKDLSRKGKRSFAEPVLSQAATAVEKEILRCAQDDIAKGSG
jgi:hypothetical protein